MDMRAVLEQIVRGPTFLEHLQAPGSFALRFTDSGYCNYLPQTDLSPVGWSGFESVATVILPEISFLPEHIDKSDEFFDALTPAGVEYVVGIMLDQPLEIMY